MASAKFIDSSEFELELSKIGEGYPEIVEKVLRVGANIIADQMKSNLQGILSPFATGELVTSFGITPVKKDSKGNWNLHLGFDGYQQTEYGRIPFQLLARSFESGAVKDSRYKRNESDGHLTRKLRPKSDWKYWRKPTPFASPAVKATRERAIKAMEKTVDEELMKIIMEG